MHDVLLTTRKLLSRQPANGGNVSLGMARESAGHRLRYVRRRKLELDALGRQFRLAKLALETARARYPDLDANALVGYCTISEDGTILRANMPAAGLFGVSRESLRNRPFSSLVSQDARARCDSLGKLAGKEAGSGEFRLLRNDGSEFLGFLMTRVEHGEKCARIVRLALIEITESSRGAGVRHESAHSEQAILDAIPSQIAVLNHDGIIVAVNAAWCEFADGNREIPGALSRYKQIGANYLAVIRSRHGLLPEAASELEKGIRAVLERQSPGFALDCSCRSPDGGQWFALSVSPFAARGVVITHVDISARKAAEERLACLHDAVLREAHHRIKNNLQGVAGLLQREQGKSMPAEPRLAAAVGRIKTIAMLHEALAANPAKITRLCESIKHICALVSELAQHPVGFQIEDMQSFRSLHVASKERVPVALVLNELILNAVKHSPDAGVPPLVSLQTDGTNAWIRIRNRVAGAPDFSLATGKGLGSGLSLVRTLLPEEGACLDYKLDQEDSMLATLCLTAPIVEATIT